MKINLSLKELFLSKHTLYSLLFFIILIFFTYFNSFNAQFVSDDISTLTFSNPQFGRFDKVFSNPLNLVRPFLLFIAYSIGGMTPIFYRIPNLLFHTGTVFVLYLLISLMFNRKYALIAASLFAVHPILTESVTWISGGPYSQAGFFTILTLLLYVLSKHDEKFYFLSLLSYLLTLTSSEKTIVFPFILILLEISFFSIKDNWKKIIPYFGISTVMGIFLLSNTGARVESVQQRMGGTPGFYNPLVQWPFAITSYLGLIFWPDKLTIYHSDLTLTIAELVVRWIFFGAFIGLIILAYKKSRVVFFWLVFFIISLLVTLTPLRVAWVVAERYVYLGTLGIISAIAYVLFKITENKKYESMVYMLITVVVIVLMARTIFRNMDWQNEDSLWPATAKVSPNSHNARLNYGDVYSRAKDYENAILEFKTAIRLKPDYAYAYHNLANAYLNTNRLDEAIKNYQEALKYDPSLWQSHESLGIVYYKMGNLNAAAKEFKMAVKLNSANAKLYTNLGILYFEVGKNEEARKYLEKALEIDPDFKNARVVLNALDLRK